MQATTLTAINGNLGSANDYHKEELELTKKENIPSSRYYLDEPESVCIFFDKGNILAPYREKGVEATSGIESDLLAVEKALSQNLDTKAKNAVAKLHGEQFKKYRSTLLQHKKLLRDYEEKKALLNPVKLAEIRAEVTELQGKIASVKEPVIGRDFTLTLEKSYSIAFALATKDEKKIWMDCYKESCQETLEMIIQEYMRSNSKKKFSKKEIEEATRKTVYGLYVHFTNRDGDPHLHAHGVVYNLLQELEGGRLKGNDFPIMLGANFLKLMAKSDLLLHSSMNRKLESKLPRKYNFKAYKLEKQSGKSVKVDLEKEDIAADLSGWNIEFDAPSKKRISELSKTSVKVSEQVDQAISEARELRDLKLASADLIADKNVRAKRKLEIVAQYKTEKKRLDTTFRREVKNRIKPAKGTVQGSFDSIADDLVLVKGTGLESGANLNFLMDFEKLVRKVTENRHAFSEIDLEIMGLKYGVSMPSLKRLVKKHLYEDQDLEGQRKYIQHDGSWYSRENLSMAMDILEDSEILAGRAWNVSVKPLSVEKRRTLYEVSNLNKDQFDAVDLCLNDKQLNIIAGLPGVGKSTVLKVIVDEIKEQSPRTEVFALSTAGKIVEQLEGDIKNSEANTLAAFSFAISSGNISLTKNSLVIVDEAGMVEDKHYHTLFREAKKSGAKIILVGDDRQLSSVGRGSSFKDIQRINKSQTVRINKIVRQRNAKLKETVELMAGSGVSDEDYQERIASNSLVREAFADLKSKNLVKTFEKSRDLFSDIAQTFLDDEASLTEKIVIASSNNEVSKINNKIQDARFKDTDIPHISLEDSDTSFFVGDRMMVTKQMNQKYSVDDPKNPGGKVEKIKKIKNGKLGTVVSVNTKNKTLIVEFVADGVKHFEEIDIEKKKDSIALGYASTVHKSQGISVDSVLLALSDNELLNSAENLNVAISRGKHRCQVFMLGQHEDKIIESHKANSKETTDLKNVKQQFFENERQRILDRERELVLSGSIDLNIDEKYFSPKQAAFSTSVRLQNDLYSFSGKPLPVVDNATDFREVLLKAFGGDEDKFRVSVLAMNEAGEICKSLFGSGYPPKGIYEGLIKKESLLIQSPAKDLALFRLIEKYAELNSMGHISVVDFTGLKIRLEELVTKPIPLPKQPLLKAKAKVRQIDDGGISR